MERIRCPNPKCGRHILDIEQMPPGETVLEMKCRRMESPSTRLRGGKMGCPLESPYSERNHGRRRHAWKK